ncbi:phospholipase D-like domain-containing protein [Gaetbulibacter saemankumensis]|uniref:hypothetical protein n=1 Tax=Gaetbulibacter saemankumensis TaxID=311208 RepID=UPI0004207F34|nr:hypothetical protein [Gaetbulibacter saemankumensis]
MKLINNQDTLLIEELKNLISEASKIYVSCNYFTSFALFELIETLKKANNIEVLLDFHEQEKDDFKFIQNGDEQKLNLKLDRKYKINQVIGLIEDKIHFRKGSIGNQNIIIIENNEVSTCFILTPQNLDSVSLGIIPSKLPIFINAFQELNQFQKN